MYVAWLVCPHCAYPNLVAVCRACGRLFILVDAHLQGKVREYDSSSITSLPAGWAIPPCDYCMEQFGKVSGLLRQKTCPACHIGILPRGATGFTELMVQVATAPALTTNSK